VSLQYRLEDGFEPLLGLAGQRSGCVRPQRLVGYLSGSLCGVLGARLGPGVGGESVDDGAGHVPLLHVVVSGVSLGEEVAPRAHLADDFGGEGVLVHPYPLYEPVGCAAELVVYHQLLQALAVLAGLHPGARDHVDPGHGGEEYAHAGLVAALGVHRLGVAESQVAVGGHLCPSRRRRRQP